VRDESGLSGPPWTPGVRCAATEASLPAATHLAELSIGGTVATVRGGRPVAAARAPSPDPRPRPVITCPDVRLLVEIFGAGTLLNVVNFVLGCHPASDTSLISVLGARSQLIVYGFNCDGYTYIPGGLISGPPLFHASGFMDLQNRTRLTARSAIEKRASREFIMSGAASIAWTAATRLRVPRGNTPDNAQILARMSHNLAHEGLADA